ncbi:MAG TPA: NDP-sugar synthase [Roseiflexaceae bacterium]|nr:NDP-sugar synthase [Roseiflexaceae bacterium]
MKAVILAAGAGTRLRPLTDTCPKPMLPVGGKPLLAHTLAWLSRYGVHEIALNTHHLPDVVRAGLGDGSAYGARLVYSHEQELLGTAGAVWRIAERYPNWFDDTFAVIYGDMLVDFDLGELARFHSSRGALLTMALKQTHTPHSQGMVEIDEQGRVLRFVEKPPAWDGGNVANAGIYICEPPVVKTIGPGVRDFGHDIIPQLLHAGAALYGRPINGVLLDIGTPEAYQQAQNLIDSSSTPAPTWQG